MAILLPREAPMIIAPLAVMAAGAAYLPLDCASPTARLREMIETARVDLIIVDRTTKDMLPAGPGGAGQRRQVLN